MTPSASWSSTRSERIVSLVRSITAAGGLGEPVLGVGRVVVVRRDDPLAVLDITWNRAGSPSRVVARRPPGRCRQRVLEVGEERLPLVVELGIVFAGAVAGAGRPPRRSTAARRRRRSGSCMRSFMVDLLMPDGRAATMA